MNGELPDHVELFDVYVVHHLGDAHLLLFGRYAKVYLAKMVTIHYVNIDYILFEWKYKRRIAACLEVYLNDLIRFIIDVLIHWNVHMV